MSIGAVEGTTPPGASEGIAIGGRRRRIARDRYPTIRILKYITSFSPAS
jgi:hypothetical protein